MKIDEIFALVQQRRKSAIAKAENNLASARKDTQFCQLDNQLIGVRIDIARSKDLKIKAELEDKEQKLYKNWQNQLKKLGLTEEMLAPQYHCKKCSDGGYLNGEYCTCVKNLISEGLTYEGGINNLPNSSLEVNLNVFPNGTHREEMQDLYGYFKNYSAKFPNTKFSTMLLVGEAGVGKTYAISALARQLVKNGHDVVYLTAFAFSQMMLAEHTNFTETRGNVIEELKVASLLIIDDLGAEPIFKNVTESYLLSIFNERQLTKKHTIFSSNLNIEELNARYGTRFISRLNNVQTTQTIILTGGNLRTQKP